MQNIKVDQKVNFEAFYQFYSSYEKVRKTIKVNLKPRVEIDKLVLEFAQIKGKPDKKEETKDLTKFENDSTNKYNLIPIGLFVGISLISYIIGHIRNNPQKSKN
jgi:adenine C2-methylase RlmN of 23S rRNA A2503 and tRNA A37